MENFNIPLDDLAGKFACCFDLKHSSIDSVSVELMEIHHVRVKWYSL